MKVTGIELIFGAVTQIIVEATLQEIKDRMPMALEDLYFIGEDIGIDLATRSEIDAMIDDDELEDGSYPVVGAVYHGTYDVTIILSKVDDPPPDIDERRTYRIHIGMPDPTKPDVLITTDIVRAISNFINI